MEKKPVIPTKSYKLNKVNVKKYIDASNKIDFIEYTGTFLYNKDAPF